MQRNAPQDKKKRKKLKFSINDDVDILSEILKRLDGPSLCAAACVCRLWCALARNDDALWEHLCFRHASAPPPAAVVLALGGYRRLYMLCLRPLLARFCRRRSDFVRRVWTLQHHLQLSLSLFSVDCYERTGWIGGDAAAPSLRFLCNPVNV